MAEYNICFSFSFLTCATPPPPSLTASCVCLSLSYISDDCVLPISSPSLPPFRSRFPSHSLYWYTTWLDPFPPSFLVVPPHIQHDLGHYPLFVPFLSLPPCFLSLCLFPFLHLVVPNPNTNVGRVLWLLCWRTTQNISILKRESALSLLSKVPVFRQFCHKVFVFCQKKCFYFWITKLC